MRTRRRLSRHDVRTPRDLQLLSEADLHEIGLSVGHRNRVKEWQQQHRPRSESRHAAERQREPGKGRMSLETTTYTVDALLKSSRLDELHFLRQYSTRHRAWSNK